MLELRDEKSLLQTLDCVRGFLQLALHAQQCEKLGRKFLVQSLLLESGSAVCPAHTAATGETNRDGRDQAYCHVIGNTVANPLVQLDENGLEYSNRPDPDFESKGLRNP